MARRVLRSLLQRSCLLVLAVSLGAACASEGELAHNDPDGGAGHAGGRGGSGGRGGAGGRGGTSARGGGAGTGAKSDGSDAGVAANVDDGGAGAAGGAGSAQPAGQGGSGVTATGGNDAGAEGADSATACNAVCGCSWRTNWVEPGDSGTSLSDAIAPDSSSFDSATPDATLLPDAAPPDATAVDDGGSFDASASAQDAGDSAPAPGEDAALEASPRELTAPETFAVAYKASKDKATATSDQISFQVQVMNISGGVQALTGLSVRYYLVDSGRTALTVSIDHAGIQRSGGYDTVAGGAVKTTLAVPSGGGAGYAEIAFQNTALQLAAGDQLVLNVRIFGDYSPSSFHQCSDYSFDPTKTADITCRATDPVASCASLNRWVTVYVGGVLAWGEPPP